MGRTRNRIPPLPIRDWGDEQKQVLMAFLESMPADFQGGATKDSDYTALELLLNHPPLARAFLPYSQWLLQDNALALRDRELAILRLSVLIRSGYEWAQHVLIAQHEGISDEEIRRVVEGPEEAGWSDKERLLLRAVDELVSSAFISDETWQGLEKYFNNHQLMEILFTVGSYNLMGMVFNSMGAPLNHKLQETMEKFPF